MSAQLQQAIINAHNAGDVAAAQRLGQMLKKERQASQVAPQAASPSGVAPHRRNQTTQPKPPTDNAFEYGIDQAQSLGGGLIEGIGKKVNSPSMQKYGQDVQKQQEKDMAEGGYQFEYDSFRDAYEKNGLSGAISHGGSSVAAGIPTTGATLIGGGATALAATYGAPAWAIATLGAATTATGVGLGIGESVLEQKEKTGNFNADLAIGVGVVSGALDRLGVRKLFNLKQLKEMSAAQIAEVLRKKGKGQKAKEFLKGLGIEGITETAQEATQMASTAVVGGQYEGQEVQDRLTDAFITGGLMSATIKTGTGTVQSATNLVRGNSKNIKNEGDVEAAASFAQDLAATAEREGYDLNDLDKMSTKGARQVVDDIHVDYTELLKQKFTDLKERLGVTDNDDLIVLLDKISAKSGYRKGRNKAKSRVGESDFAAIEKLAGDTYEGQEVLAILRKLNQLTEVHNSGYQGGVSRLTDQFAPFGTSVGYDSGAIGTERILRPIVSGQAALASGGATLAAQGAAWATGRLIDKATGKRSKVATYIADNASNQGLAAPKGPSLRMGRRAQLDEEAQAAEEARLRQEQMAQEDREASLESAQKNDPANPESPQGIFELGTALDRNGIAQILRIMKRNPSTLPATLRMIDAYETSVATGGQVDFALIRKINGFVDSNSVYKGLMGNRARNQGVVDQASQQQLSQKEQNYQRGIDNNRAEAARITEAVNQDKTIQVQHKAHLLSTLEEMQLDLGLNPVGRLQTMQKRLEEKGVPGPTVEKYLGQYLQRVMAQQGAKAERDAAQDDVMEIDESREPSFTSSPGRVSPAMPTGKSPLFDANVEKTPVSLALINKDPKLPERIVNKMRPYIPFRDAPVDDQDFLEKTVEFMKNNLVALHGSVSPEYRDRSKLWYVGANKLSQGAADTYGQTLEAVAGVMSALSPGLDWYVNYDIGVRLLDIYTNHQDTVFGDSEYSAAMKFVNNIKVGTPRQEANRAKHKAVIESMEGKTLAELSPAKQAYFVRFHDVANATERGHRIVTPEGELGDFVQNKNGSKKAAVFSDFPPIATAMAIMANPSPENISSLMGIGHKRRNFYNNILDPMNDQGDVTIDTHAVGAALFLPLSQRSVEVVNNFGTPDSANIGSYGTYGVYAEAYRRAAAEVGILPREMQSITWEAARGLFPAEWKAQKKNVDSIRSIWDDYKSGTISLEKARQTVYETAGNIRAAQWENDRPNFSIDARNEIPNDSRSVPGSGLPGGNQLRSRSNAPGGVPQPSQEVNLSAVPGSGALTQPESAQIPFDFTAPSVGQIKDKLEDAKGAVQMVIGKPGTKFENGLSSMEDFKQLADMLNVSVGIFDSQKEFMEKYSVTKGTRGLYGSNKGGVSGQIAILANGIESDLLYTTAHESAHPLESRPASNEEAELLFGRKVSGRHPKSENVKRNVYANSLRAKLRGKYGSDPVIQSEIDKLQDGTVIFIANRPDLPGRPARLNLGQTYEMFRDENPQGSKGQALLDAQNSFPAYQGYMKGDGEFAVDPVMFYLINPKAMKKDMPNTFKFMQKHFNESNIPIKIYASPLATIMAILMAGMIGGEEEEEENPGILTPGPGMLSA